MSSFYTSGFYTDGYSDAAKGFPLSPPDVPVYADEYIRGYNDQHHASRNKPAPLFVNRLDRDESYYAFANKGGLTNPV